MLSLSGVSVQRATAAPAPEDRLPAIDSAQAAAATAAAPSPPRANGGAHTERSSHRQHKQQAQPQSSPRRLAVAPAPLPSVLPHFPVAEAAAAAAASAQPRYLSKLLAQAERDEAQERKSGEAGGYGHSASAASLIHPRGGPVPPASLSASASARKLDLRPLLSPAAGGGASSDSSAVADQITRMLEQILDEHTADLLRKFQQDLLRAKKDEKQHHTKATAAATVTTEAAEAATDATAADSALQRLADWTPAPPAASSVPAPAAIPLTSRDRARLAWFEKHHPALQSSLQTERGAWRTARTQWAAAYEGLAAKYTALLGHTNNISAVLKQQQLRNDEMESALHRLQQPQPERPRDEEKDADAVAPSPVVTDAAATIASSLSRRSSGAGLTLPLTALVAAAAAPAAPASASTRPLAAAAPSIDSSSQTPAQWRATFALQFASMLPAHTDEDDAAAEAGTAAPVQPLMEQTMRAYEMEAARIQQQQQQQPLQHPPTEDDPPPAVQSAPAVVPRPLHIEDEASTLPLIDVPSPVFDSRGAVDSLVSAMMDPANRRDSTAGAGSGAIVGPSDGAAAEPASSSSSRRKTSNKKRASGQVTSLASPQAASAKSKRSSMRAPRALDKSASTASIQAAALATAIPAALAAAVILSPSASAAILPTAAVSSEPHSHSAAAAISGSAPDVAGPQVTFRGLDAADLADLASETDAAPASTASRSQLQHRRRSNNPQDCDRFSDGGFSASGGGGAGHATLGSVFGSTRGSSPAFGQSSHGLSPSRSSSILLTGSVGGGGETLETLSDRWKARLLKVKVSLARAESKNEALVQLLRGSDERNIALLDALSKLRTEAQAQSTEMAAMQRSSADLTAQLRLAQQNKPKKELQSALSSAEAELLSCRSELTALRAQQIEFKRALFQLSSLRSDLSRAWAKSARAAETQQHWKAQMEQALGLVSVLQSELVSTKESHHADLRRLKKRLVLKSIWFRTQIMKLERLHQLALLLDHYLKPELSCPGCLEMFQYPQSLSPCGHSLCARCVQKQKQERGGSGVGVGGGVGVGASARSGGAGSSVSGGGVSGDRLECAECHRLCDSSAPNLTLESVLSRVHWWSLLMRDCDAAKQLTLTQERDMRNLTVKEPAPQHYTPAVAAAATAAASSSATAAAAAAAAASNRAATVGPLIPHPRAGSPSPPSSAVSSASDSPRPRTRFA